MKKTFFILSISLFFIISCEKNDDIKLQDDVITKQIIRSYELPNNSPKVNSAYIKGKFNGKAFYINEGDEGFSEFKLELWQTQNGSNTTTTNATFLKISTGDITVERTPVIQFNTFPQKGIQSTENLLKKNILEKDYAINNSDKDSIGWEVEILYPKTYKNLVSKQASPTLSSICAGKTQDINRYFKVSKVEYGSFPNNRTRKVTFNFDLDIFYKNSFELFDRVEQAEMVVFLP